MPDQPWISDEDRALVRQRNAEARAVVRRGEHAIVKLAARHRRSMRVRLSDMVMADYLYPWMQEYAEWLCAQPTAPKTTHKLAAANQLSKMKWTRAGLLAVERRPDFAVYLDTVKGGGVELARATYRRRLPEYIDANYDALKRAQEAGDYKAVAQISEPAVDRVMPKKGDTVAATQVNIMLSPTQLAGFQQYAPADVEVEVVPPPQGADGTL